MQKIQPLQYGKYFHIYNRGNNSENIFLDKQDYIKFLEYFSIYILSIADVYAWCLLKNHFHIFVRIKDEEEIGYINPANLNSKNKKLRWKTYNLKNLPDIKNADYRKPKPEKQFSHFFNAYAKKFNFKYKRTGALLEQPYERILIEDENYLKNIVRYIHYNPVKHKFVKKINQYYWSSFNSFLSELPTNLERKTVLDWFDNKENFMLSHSKKDDFKDIDDYLFEK